MDFEFSPEQEQLRATVRRFLEEAAPVDWVRERLEEDRGTTDQVWRGLAELGLAGLLVPEESGGAGLGMLDMGVVVEEMGRALHPGPFLASAVGATLAMAGTPGDADRAAWLGAMAEGRRVATLLAPPLAEATRRAAGWSVTGASFPVLDAAAADALLVAAPAGGETALFAVEPGAPGVEIGSRPSVDGTRKQAAVTLRDAPAERLAGDAAEALAKAEDAMAVALAVDGVGAAARAFELALAYANEREQFGVPIGSFQAVKHLLVDMLRDLELTRAGAYYALWAIDAGDARERRRAAAMAKAFAGTVLPRIGADAIQVFGGVGYTWEYDVHLYYKRLLSLRHCWGDVGQHLDELARIAVDG